MLVLVIALCGILVVLLAFSVCAAIFKKDIKMIKISTSIFSFFKVEQVIEKKDKVEAKNHAKRKV